MSVSIVLAGGGTTGHLSPLIATAQALGDAQITCVGTAKGLETTVVPVAGLDLKLISADPLPRKPTFDLVKLPFRMLSSVRQAGAVIDQVKAKVVVGFGGYVALPVYIAAWRRHLPFVMHEQNALPGLANKLMAGRAAAVLVTFPGTPLPKARCVGLPVRAAVAALADGGMAAARPAARAGFGLPPDGPVLLVSGGSQGARSINNAVVAARDALLNAGISILHVWGSAGFPPDAGVISVKDTRYVPLAYVDDMAQAYAAADLMLARAGAATVAETATIGLPCLFVPFPHGNGEQVRNAQPLLQAGAAELVLDADVTPDVVEAAVTRLLGDPGHLAEMGAAAQGVMQPDAAQKVAKVVLALAGGKP